MSSSAQDQVGVTSRFLLDPYLDWANGEGVPVHLDFGHDLLKLTTDKWARYDARGCFAHTHGRGDFASLYVLEIDPGKKTSPIKHLYEALYFVLAGHGSTTVWFPDGSVRTFEWGPKAFFTVPLNCQYQIFNGSGQEPARISVTNDAPLTINLYHNLDFVFTNDFKFPERVGHAKHFDGEGDYAVHGSGTAASTINVWETNFVHDLTSFKLYDLDVRGKGSRNVIFQLADGTMHAHVSEIPVGRYKKGHRHGDGIHVHAVDGAGYTLIWYDGDDKFVELPWRHGVVYTPPFWKFHQHFNTSASPARYLACSIGSARYPFISLRRVSTAGGGSTSVKQGGRQIEYEDQDPRIHRKFLEEIKKTGVVSKMGDAFNEPAIMALPQSALTGAIRNPQLVGPAV